MKRVLVVDDNEINRLVMTDMLRALGVDVDAAANGELAVEKVLGGTFDLVLMDCQMPLMDGYQAATEIRRREDPTSRVPIVALTAHAQAADRARAIDAGMDDYLVKPIGLAGIAATLERWAAVAGSLRLA